MAEFLQLAIDTSTTLPAVALLQGENILCDWQGPEGLRHHETLLAGVDHCLRAAEVQLSDLAFLSVGVGPGMFTGLRIGIATAKFLADPLQLPCVAVSSLVALADQSGLLGTAAVWAVSDAKAKRVYALPLRPGDQDPQWNAPTGEEIAVTPEEAAKAMRAGDFLIGEGAFLYREHWPAGIKIAEQNSLLASSVGRVGARRYRLALTCTATDLQPTYLKTGHL